MSRATNTRPHVLIIGGGLGGAALAQALRKEEVSFDLFERDRSGDSRWQGWAVSLHAWIIEAFQQSLKTDLPDIRSVSTTLNLEVPSEGCIFDATNMQEFWRFGSQPGSEFIRADRAKLRAWLLTGVNVRWNKYFTHYHQDANGVTAFFSDGTSYTGDILVGADGVNSHVRSSLLPDPKFRPDYVPMGIIVGELIATEDQYRAWMNTAASFFIGLAGDRRIFVGLKAVAKNQKSAKYYWLFGWPDDDARKEGYWTVSASQEELHSYVLDHLDGVDSSFADILRATPVEGMLHPPLRMRDMTPPELPRGRVTMLGDAAHAMVPFRGEGGNMAMKDGLNLAACVGASASKAVEDVLKEYESEMIARTTESVLASRAAATAPNMSH